MKKTGMDRLKRGAGGRTEIRYKKGRKESLRGRICKAAAGRRARAFAGQILVMTLFLSLYIVCPTYAATGTTNTGVIKTGFGVVYDIIAAIISSVGQLYLLWGVFEWATALNSQDGTMQSMAFKRIAAGLVACLTPQLIPLVTAGIK